MDFEGCKMVLSLSPFSFYQTKLVISRMGKNDVFCISPIFVLCFKQPDVNSKKTKEKKKSSNKDPCKDKSEVKMCKRREKKM